MVTDPMIRDAGVSARVAHVRKMCGLSQRKLSSLLGFGEQYLSLMETNKKPFSIATLTHLVQLVRQYGVVTDMTWLLTGAGEKPSSDPHVEARVETEAQKTLHDPFSHFFHHALALAKLYPKSLYLYVSSKEFEPLFRKGEFLIAPEVAYDRFYPRWQGYYLFQTEAKVMPVRLEPAGSNTVSVTSVHHLRRRQLDLGIHPLKWVYPIVGRVTTYARLLEGAPELVRAIQVHTQNVVVASPSMSIAERLPEDQ